MLSTGVPLWSPACVKAVNGCLALQNSQKIDFSSKGKTGKGAPAFEGTVKVMALLSGKC